ncbi:hypothetical protein APHAL10511_002844 [Amanita phalloides]|nr:hypothetical protein APHAL10511_002844 [Amanita phalloides]
MGSVKLTVGIEESRAQRQQRQQSRFRDRGGIFKPSNRNTLVDILMGRRAPSPKKSTRRSASCSPSKGDKNPSKVGAGINAIRNDPATSHTKISRLHQVPVPLKDSGLKDSRNVQSSESGANEISAVRTKSQPVAKRRGRPPKRPKSVVTGDRQEDVGGSESNDKTSKSEPPTQRKRTSSKKSKTSTAKIVKPLSGLSSISEETGRTEVSGDKTSTAKLIKPLSRLSSIAEETGRSEVSGDKTSTATESRGAKQGSKKKRDAVETFREVHMADYDDEETAILREKTDNSRDSDFTVTGTSRDSSKKKPNRLIPTTPNHACMDKPGKRRRVKSDSMSGSTEIAADTSTIEPDNSANVNRSFVKERRPSTLNIRRKHQPDSGHNNDGDENRGPSQKRVISAMECGKSSKGTPQNGLGAAKTLISNYRDVDSIVEQIPDTSKVASHDDNAKGSSSFISLEMSGAKSKKRTRNPEDSSSTSLKRVKLGNASTKDSEPAENTRDLSAESGETNKAAHADNVAVKKEVVPKPVSSSIRSKENSTVSKKPPKAGGHQTKPKAPNKRTKGLPRRVLQRLKQSEPDQIDDEPDPIDFLS